jgi:hypothetical protein
MRVKVFSTYAHRFMLESPREGFYERLPIDWNKAYQYVADQYDKWKREMLPPNRMIMNVTGPMRVWDGEKNPGYWLIELVVLYEEV